MLRSVLAPILITRGRFCHSPWVRYLIFNFPALDVPRMRWLVGLSAIVFLFAGSLFSL